MKTFVVGYIDWFDNQLILEKIEAPSWAEAILKHSKYPFTLEDEVSKYFPDKEYPEMTDEESFKQQCFDCDCMINWIEL